MWCENDKVNFDSHLGQVGQINSNFPAGQKIIETLKNNELRNIVDIGTWNGMGSTLCFLLGLEGNNTTKLISVESNKDKNLLAIENLGKLLSDNPNAQLWWGTIIESSEMTDIHSVFPEVLENSEFSRWHSIDVENMNNAPYIFKFMPEEIDFVLFDGGEFTTYYEFLKLFPRCKKFIALDDVDCAKCKKIRDILNAHEEWTELDYIPERNGFSLFRKK